MSIINTIKADQLQSRKDKNKFLTQTLTTVMGEIEKIGKDDGNRETTDVEAVKVLRKTRSSVEFTIKTMLDVDGRANIATQAEEIQILNKYIPQQYSEDKIMNLLLDFQQELAEQEVGLTLPLAMKFLKSEHEGQYDGKLASFVVRDMLGQS